MIDPHLLQKGQELGVVAIDESEDKVTYRLGRESRYTWSHPEEQVRAEMILDIIFNYQYSPLRMDTEVTVPDRVAGVQADIVVFRDDRLKDPYITIETGAPQLSEAERTQKVEQLFGYSNALASVYAVYYDGTATKQNWRVQGHGGLERERNVIADIPKNYGNIPVYKFQRGGQTDLDTVDANHLSRVFDQCHNELWSGGRLDPTEAFDEMSKLIFAKLYDELQTPNQQPYHVQWGERETDIMVADRVVARYEAARVSAPSVFIESIRSEPRKIGNVVRRLEPISLSQTDADAKGRAFEQFLGEVFRGRLGQYFTRREIVEFLVELAEPTKDDMLLDPACGSGGFLVYTMKNVFQQIEKDYAGQDSTIFRLKEAFSKQHIYGIEVNAKIARVAMMDMVINDDGHTNIEPRTAFDASFKNPGIANGHFSLILTNPPFGDHVRRDERDKLGQAELSDYTLSRGRSSAKSEVLFIERCNLFLRQGGRLGMVVPDGILSNPSDQHVREYLLQHFCIQAIVTLPAFAFRKAGSGMKTSLVLARKWQDGEWREQDYPIFMAIAEHIGYDATARPDTNELPALLSHYRNGTGSLDDKVARVQSSDIRRNQRLDPLFYYLGPIIDQAFASLPYRVATLREIAGNTIQSGKSPKGGAKYSVGEVPIILVGNMAPDGTLTFDDSYYAESDFFDAQKDKASVEPLDILIAKDGATTGKVGIVPEDFERDRCLINEHIFRFRVGPSLPGDDPPSDDDDAKRRWRVNTWYVFFFLKSWLGQQQVTREVSGGAQGGITKRFVERIRIPLPPWSTRERFVAEARQEYAQYIDLARRARNQLSNFTDSLGTSMRAWGENGEDADIAGGSHIMRRV